MKKLKAHNIIGNIYKNVQKSKWTCLHLDCEDKAINSHLAQRNGILNELVVNGHLVQLNVTDPNTWNKQSPIRFKLVGYNQAISVPVFCNIHDAEIFKPIEISNTKKDDYETFLLFSYRTLCAEIRKKEIAIEKNNRIIHSKSLDELIDKVGLQENVISLQYGIRDLLLLKTILSNEIILNNNKFSYWHYKLPKLEIFASEAMSLFPLRNRNVSDVELEILYFHILPRPNYTSLLIGFHNDYTNELIREYCLSWNSLSDYEIEIQLTDLLTNHVENWVMSPNLFNKISQEKRKKYLNYFIKYLNHYTAPQAKGFNLFR